MIRMARHIEILLLDNDCVIIPRVGGFVAHYSPSKRIEDENVFYPPYRTIGFNAQLKINDGVLAESYMNFFGIGYAEANKRIDKEVDELLSVLHEEGKVELTNIGILRYNIYGTYEFTPFDNKLITPSLYGLSDLSIKCIPAEQPKPVAEEEQSNPIVTTSQQISVDDKEEISDDEEETDKDKPRKDYVIRINRTLVRTAAAVAAIIVLLFTFSTPIHNSSIALNNEAKIIPDELINKLKSESLLTNLVSEPTSATVHKTIAKPTPVQKTATKAASQQVAVKDSVRSVLTNNSAEKKYHLIIASSITKKSATALASNLQADGYKDAEVLISGKMIRVSIAASNNLEDAQNMINKLSKKTEYKNIWVMKGKHTSSSAN